MKILKIAYKNIGIFSEGFSVDFTATDRVVNFDQVDNFYKNFYTQKVLSIIGANASGKSTALKLIKMAMDIVIGNKSLDAVSIPSGAIQNGTLMTVVFFYNDSFYKLESEIGTAQLDLKSGMDDIQYNFLNEKIYQKQKSDVKSKKMIDEFSDNSMLLERAMLLNNEFSTLKDQDSIVAAITKKNTTRCLDMINETNFNIYRVAGKAQMECINLFDDSVESVELKNNKLQVCFKSTHNQGQCESDLLSGETFLSSGTIKGGNLLFLVSSILRNGGYLLVDEIENHMHKKLVQTIIEFFTDPEINKHGATLVFSTHYAEIIDSVDRKDNIYVLVRTKDHIARVNRYSDLISRNDIKKSEIFLSNFIKGTSPSYENITKVRDFLCKAAN